ncbi:MAG TPA: hypothetical protein VMV92_07105 [Streptosporangiaceae bacterium]|nr:hypothetical protein [Streptosporangiaceae bacterium]
MTRTYNARLGIRITASVDTRLRHLAAMEAGSPDIGALFFAALGITLALHGRRALRARTLNVACVGISLAMNALASAPGWRDLAIWIMPSAVYALASDTLIGRHPGLGDRPHPPRRPAPRQGLGRPGVAAAPP